MRLAVLLVPILAVLCAAPSAAQPAVGVPEVPPDPAATVFIDNPGIVADYPTRPQAYSRLPGERTLRLYFTSGTPQCYGVTATVEERPDEVVVSMRSGTLPHALDRACILIALVAAIDVPLQQPLGARVVRSAT